LHSVLLSARVSFKFVYPRHFWDIYAWKRLPCLDFRFPSRAPHLVRDMQRE
jgi:hypothetical protein